MVITGVLALSSSVIDDRAAVVAFGIAAVAVALLASLQRQATLLPALVVLLAAAQFLVASSTTAMPERVLLTAGDACVLWIVHWAYSLCEQTDPRAALRSSVLVRGLVRGGLTFGACIPVAILVAGLGEDAPKGDWLRFIGPTSAAVLCASVAVLALRRRA